ncbi:MAG: type I-C CRISPR-associated protein Cas5 [Dethiobacter sp.]|jgi:CRISPR-associated protein Cas5d|nr:type I-C CRISPR-associated protein Cas5 [Dethiobacter sp.]MBS3989224.1 type I-C CRISPR-associated protein Cas5 [Dethiobacter sp.]
MMHRNTVEFVVHGKYALFSDPITRVGGEKLSYQIPTYQALKGILESVYWKPTFIWYIDEARVMNKIQTQSKGIRPICYKPLKKNGNLVLNDLAYYTYLKDVCYHVRAHFEWNENRPELAYDRNEHKHHNIAKRMIERGGRRDIFIGTRECQAYVEPCTFGEGEGFYDSYGELSFGVMVHGFDYPDETGKDEMSVRLWKSAKMDNGYIKFPLPHDESQEIVRRFIRPMKAKIFEDKVNFLGLEEPEFTVILAESGAES